LTDTLLDNVHINFDSEALWVLNILIGVLSQFVLLPLVTFILILILKPYPSIALGMIMVAACPGGNISNFITHLAGGNSALSVCLTAIATLMAVIMTPLSLEFWGSLYKPTAQILETVAIAPFEMVKLVALLLGLPLFLGMCLHHFRPKLALILAKGLKPLSLLFFIALVFLALYNNMDIFLDYIFYVFWIVLLHNLLAFFTGFSISKIFKLNQKNGKSITIETGIQNSGLGLLLIFTFFDGLGGMALLTAFWGIWHLVSGLLLAGYWSKSIVKKETLA